MERLTVTIYLEGLPEDSIREAGKLLAAAGSAMAHTGQVPGTIFNDAGDYCGGAGVS